jgi:anion-transporting  ArsA/GET3 family ATPase
MHPPFFRDGRLLIVAGKGGVGKTTVAAVTATAAGQAGLRTLLVGVDDSSGAASLFGTDPIDELPRTVRPNVTVRRITPDQALLEWLQDKRLGRLADRMVKNGMLDIIATAVPGIRDILVLGRIKALVNEGKYDLIVVDGPASGHAITFLESAHGLLDAVSAGAIRQQAADVAAMLSDPAMTQVVLVTLPEWTPVTETVETAFALEDRVGVRLGPIIVNQLLQPLAAAALGGSDSVESLLPAQVSGMTALIAGRQQRETSQSTELSRLRQELPLPTFTLPALPTEAGGELLDELVRQLTGTFAQESV